MWERMPEMRKKNIFVTGLPGYGKSTLIERVVGQLMVKTVGFITCELRERSSRVGFSIDTLDAERKCWLTSISRAPFESGNMVYGSR